MGYRNIWSKIKRIHIEHPNKFARSLCGKKGLWKNDFSFNGVLLECSFCLRIQNIREIKNGNAKFKTT